VQHEKESLKPNIIFNPSQRKKNQHSPFSLLKKHHQEHRNHSERVCQWELTWQTHHLTPKTCFPLQLSLSA